MRNSFFDTFKAYKTFQPGMIPGRSHSAADFQHSFHATFVVILYKLYNFQQSVFTIPLIH